MKYGLPELPEEKDIPEHYRKMLNAGIAWGCSYLNGFLESMNAKREPADRFTVLVRHPGECDFCDFVFAIKNRICAVVFDVYSWQHHLLTYERRKRLIEASLEHRLMPIVVNLTGGWHMEPYKEPEPGGFETAKRWMTDAVSGISILPEIGFACGDEEVFYPLDEWAAELYAKKTARLALEERGFTIVQIYPDSRFIWTEDRDGKPTWVLLSFHHAAIKEQPDYSNFDTTASKVEGKSGYGVDVALSNGKDESLIGAGYPDTIYRSSNLVAEVVAIKKLSEGTEVTKDTIEGIKNNCVEKGDFKGQKEQGDLLEGGGQLQGLQLSGGMEHPPKQAMAAGHKISKSQWDAMSTKEKVSAACIFYTEKLKTNPDNQTFKGKLQKAKLMYRKLWGKDFMAERSSIAETIRDEQNE